MRVKIAQQLQSAATRIAMSIDQCLGINFEVRFGRGVDIADPSERSDTAAIAEQHPASFARMLFIGCRMHCLNHIPCHFDMHRAWN